MRLTLTESQNASHSIDEIDFNTDELKQLLSDYNVGEKDGYALIPALFKPCPSPCRNHGQKRKVDCGGAKPHRLKENVTHMTGFAADLDDVTEATMKGAIERLQARGIEFYVWETYSHDPKAVAKGEAKGRYRVLIPFKEPLSITNPDQWSKGTWPRLVAEFGLGGIVDAACSDPSRLYYLPRAPEASERESACASGESFDATRLASMTARQSEDLAAPAVENARAEAEDPTRPVNLEAIKARLCDTRNSVTRALAQQAVRGELLTPLPKDRKPGDLSRHEAWFLLTGRLSIVAEDWMSTEALLEVLRPSHTRERELSPEDFTSWDSGRDSIVEMLAMQRANAPQRREAYRLEREKKRAATRNAFNSFLRARGGAGLPQPAPEDTPIEDAEDGQGETEPAAARAWTVEQVQEALEVKHSATGVTSYPGTFKNVACVLGMAPEWRGALRYNNLKDQAELWPCEAVDIQEPTPLHSVTISLIRLSLSASEHYPLSAQREDVREAANLAADRNRYEPIQEYLHALKWDGTKRLDTWLQVYLHARTTTEDGADLLPYLAAIGKRWMISSVARAFRPGCQVDTILQLESKQGIRKSSALKVLGGEWFTEGTFDFQSKETSLILATSWIVELGERAAFDRASEAVQKEFLSRRVDTLVKKYENTRSDLRRRCVFAGTTNQDQYLTDATGNRRHWVCFLEGDIDTDKLAADRDQLWAEAVVLYRAGEQWHLTKDEEMLAELEAAKRVNSDMLDDLIESWFLRTDPKSRPQGVLPVDIARRVLEDVRGTTRKSRITSALKRLGFVNKVARLDGAIVRRWLTPKYLLDAPLSADVRDTFDRVAQAKTPIAKA